MAVRPEVLLRTALPVLAPVSCLLFVAEPTRLALPASAVPGISFLRLSQGGSVATTKLFFVP